ncbi:MAG: glycosyltransferase, partial [Chitinophagales bacterium]|nr:glycosyltransferase [Chitinophagales bacterium]
MKVITPQASTDKMDFFWINAQTINDAEHLNELIFSTQSDYICISYPSLWERMEKNFLENKLTQAHVLHAGLCFTEHSLFEELAVVSFNWNFLDPDKSRDNYSWKATEHFIVFRKDIFLSLGGFDPSFSLTATVAEFCYRVMKSGGLVQYLNYFKGLIHEVSRARVTTKDVLLFAAKHISIRHARLLKLYFYCRFKFEFVSFSKVQPVGISEKLNGLIVDRPVKVVGNYTAIIPTILRYEFIVRSIESLKKSEFPPSEIIIVDQTPIHDRQPSVYEPYIREGLVRVFYLNEPGQCTSRNLAIREARTEWLLFFEDDTEAWPGMMQEHKYLMEHSLADVSTGVSLAPWKDESYIPARNRKYHVSDVLATGNCFMHRDTALSVNGLHPAFNKGPGADDDFGRRLFLAGKLIVFNHKAIQTHHKAPTGGMRIHGAWW